MSRDDLSPAERKRLVRALLEAFDRDHLERLVSFSLDQDLSAITSPGDREDVTFQLVQWMIRYGHLATFVEAAFEENPGNLELRRFRLEIWEPGSSEPMPRGARREGKDTVPRVAESSAKPGADSVAGSGVETVGRSPRLDRRFVVVAAAGLVGAGILGVRWWLAPDGPIPAPLSIGDLPFSQDFIPKGMSNRLGLSMLPTHITVHETGNTSPGSGAQLHRDWYKDGAPGAGDGPLALRSVHWIIDDKDAIQLLPHDEVALHSNSDDANTKSLAVATCVGSDLDETLVHRNLILVLANLIRENTLGGLDLSRIVQHNHWEDVECPRRVRAEGLWDDILAAVDRLV